MIQLFLKKNRYWLLLYLAMVVIVMVFGMDVILYILTEFYFGAYFLLSIIKKCLGGSHGFQLPMIYVSLEEIGNQYIYIYSDRPTFYYLPQEIFLFRTGLTGALGPDCPSFLHSIWVTILEAFFYYGGEKMWPYVEVAAKYTGSREYSSLINRFEMFSLILSCLWFSDSVFKFIFGNYVSSEAESHEKGVLWNSITMVAGIMQSAIDLGKQPKCGDRFGRWAPFCLPLKFISSVLFWGCKGLTLFPKLVADCAEDGCNRFLGIVDVFSWIDYKLFSIVKRLKQMVGIKKGIDTKSTELESEVSSNDKIDQQIEESTIDLDKPHHSWYRLGRWVPYSLAWTLILVHPVCYWTGMSPIPIYYALWLIVIGNWPSFLFYYLCFSKGWDLIKGFRKRIHIKPSELDTKVATDEKVDQLQS